MATCNFKSTMALRGGTLLLLLSIFMLGLTSGRLLDEMLPAVALDAPLDTPADPAPVETPPAVISFQTPPPTPSSIDMPPSATASAPATVAPTTAPATPAAAVSPAADHRLTFFMHDIVGGSNPSARMVTGVVANGAVSAQLPFAKPNGAVIPANGDVPLNKTGSGIIDDKGIHFLTGLGGAASGNNTVVNGAGAGGNLPAGMTLQKLLFGTMTVIDDELTEGGATGSGVVGRAQGFYIASSEEGTSQTMAFTAMFKDGEYADSISFFGVHRTTDTASHVAVVGGTGKYVDAKGFATLRVLPQVDHTDGVETLLQIDVQLV